jgi:hypothetical protein
MAGCCRYAVTIPGSCSRFGVCMPHSSRRGPTLGRQSRHHIGRIDNCTSVTFKSYIYYSGGYLTSLPVVTLWG